MKTLRAAYFTLVIVFTSPLLCAQPVEKITIRKNSGFIYFFQKGPASDTVTRNKSDLFYLLVPDSLKEHISILVENGLLRATGNDSLVKLEFLRGLNYESLYVDKEEAIPAKNKKTPKVLKSGINGSSQGVQGNSIVIRILNRKEEKTVLTNMFYYRE